MLRKLVILGALLGVVAAGAIQPAEANDEIVAEIVGNVATNTADCNTNEERFGGDGVNGEAGRLNKFGQVVIVGTFTTPGADYAGPLSVDPLDACAVTDIPVGPVPPFINEPIPAQTHGLLEGGSFGSRPGDVGVDAATGNLVCLRGNLAIGGQFGTVGAQATATISATWTVHPANAFGTCANHPATVLGSGGASMIARVAAVPLGDLTAGALDSRVAGTVTIH